ncbi:hypothetical protein [Rhizobacter sp. LjRoot28]|uniref:hypothetical protein n=1 Tax=Rhizobacter sp. LjRoot28 TaxID=3342309 RepID=UPI003ECF97AE
MGALNLGGLAAAVAWEVRRAARRVGAWGLLLAAATVLAVGAWAAERHQALAAAGAQQRWLDRPLAVDPVVRAAPSDARDRLHRFDTRLLPHDDLPTQVQDLIALAESERLTVARGEYRPQVDAEGGFLRYRMSLPVRGEWRAVHRFVDSALRAHPSLGLESVQFQRPQVDAVEVEARLQWVVLAQLPRTAVARSTP